MEKLSSVTINEHEVLISYDVSALFTSVPVDESITIIRDRLIHDDTLAERTTLNPDQIIELLSFCLKTTYFQFNDCLYRQVEGAAMASQVSTVVWNDYLLIFSQKCYILFHKKVGNSLQIIKYINSSRFQHILKL